jgi:single-stranded-DNA-specific exonuclease
MQIQERSFSPVAAHRLLKQGVDPVLARVFAGRGVTSKSEVTTGVEGVVSYDRLTDATRAAEVLYSAIRETKRILIVSDYDADGATACAVGLRALRAFGGNVGYLIPNRLEHGYGLTPEIVQIAANLSPRPELLVTVDNGISSHAGIAEANRLGIPVLVTDHHLPPETLPEALLIVNPNRRDCSFPSKALAGCGVMWYVLWALEDLLRSQGHTPSPPEFSVKDLLPLIAIGTVADVVPLDANNRCLVRAGLEQIHEAPTMAGVASLCKVAKRDHEKLTTSDIGFGIGPRINAAGRLQSMAAGVECLITDDPEVAMALANQLQGINDERREIEAEAVIEAAEQVAGTVQSNRFSAVAYHSDWHKGVIGIVAGRVRELVYRPTFVLTSDASGHFTGSGRSIPGFHLRDALDLIAKRAPGVLVKYGGHAMAAGATLAPGSLERFEEAFEAVARELLTPADLRQTLETDGSLEVPEMTLETAERIRSQVWGQAFPEPTFVDTFRVINARRMGKDEAHLRLFVEKGNKRFTAVKFRAEPGEVPGRVRAVFKLNVNTYQNMTSLQLLVDHLGAA